MDYLKHNPLRVAGTAALSVVLAVGLMVPAIPDQAYATPTSAQKQAEAQAVLQSLEAMQEELDAASDNYFTALDEQEQAKQKMDEAQQRIDEASDEIAELQVRLGDRAKSMYRNGSASLHGGLQTPKLSPQGEARLRSPILNDRCESYRRAISMPFRGTGERAAGCKSFRDTRQPPLRANQPPLSMPNRNRLPIPNRRAKSKSQIEIRYRNQIAGAKSNRCRKSNRHAESKSGSEIKSPTGPSCALIV